MEKQNQWNKTLYDINKIHKLIRLIKEKKQREIITYVRKRGDTTIANTKTTKAHSKKNR